MLHLRIVAPPELADRVLEILDATESVINVIVLRGAARKPEGDVLLCDVAREDASVVLSDLRAMGVQERGSIAVEEVDTALSSLAVQAERAAGGSPADAVVWEQVTDRTSEESALSGSFLLFMVLAMLIGAVGIFLDSEILVVGAMVVGPEFGPIAGLSVALVQLRGALAGRSALALLVGFPVGILVTVAVVEVFQATGVTPEVFTERDHSLSRSIANPDFLAFFVAFCAGAAGMLSLSTAKSGALIGVLISVTTIPAAANVGVAAAYEDWEAARGSLAQLGLNLSAIVLAGILTLWVQRLLYLRRKAQHRGALRELALDEPAAPPRPGVEG